MVSITEETLSLVDLETWVNTENRRVRFGISGEPIKLETLWCIGNAFVECLKLLAFEWDGAVLVTVGDEESVFLDVGDAEGSIRKWREEGGIGGNLVELVGDGVPRHRERHTLLFVSVVKTLLSPRSRLVESSLVCDLFRVSSDVEVLKLVVFPLSTFFDMVNGEIGEGVEVGPVILGLFLTSPFSTRVFKFG